MYKFLRFFIVCLSFFIFTEKSFATLNCSDSVVSATNPCAINLDSNYILHFLSTDSSRTYSSYTPSGGTECCRLDCVSTATFDSGIPNCKCPNGTYKPSTLNQCDTCTSNCSVSNGSIASISTNTNNQCVYTISCSTGYELSTNNCTPTGGTATCTAKHYDVTLKNYDYSEAVVHDVIFNQPMPNLPSGLPILRAGYVFNGYTNDSGNTYYDASGNSARNWDIDTTTPKLYDSWSACATGAAGNGTITNIVVNNTCKYYITCISGFQNTVSYNIDTAGTNSTLTCSTCSAGYFCPGGERQPCPAGMTSSSGATQENDCFYQGGASGTKFCDSNGCLHLPINIGY